MTVEPWFIAAMTLSLSGYAIYLAGLRRHLLEPSRASWLIWTVATGVEAATYAAVNRGEPQGVVFIASAMACIVVTLAMWRRSRWSRPTSTETVCMAASLAAIVLWLPLQETFWAHMLVVAAVPLGFWPTWTSVWADRARERSPAWGLWTLGDLATLMVTIRSPGSGVGEYAYVLVELLCHASVWLMVGLATLNPVRSFGRREGKLRVLDAYLPANPFAVAQTHIGKAVFAAQGFAPAETIVRFSGPIIPAARLPHGLSGASDRYLQIDRDRYMGPSGRIDDLINHSCTPNAGLRFARDRVTLVALRRIAAGEEIAWDYSTTLADPDWSMRCACGSADCRDVIRAFPLLPDAVQDRYRAMGIVAPYLEEQVAAARAA